MNNCGTVTVFVLALPSCSKGNLYSDISEQFFQPSLIKYLIIK